MTWDYTFKVTDIAIIFATVMGPIFAVQVQKWVERGRADKARQQAIFSTLMATRATRLSPAHVEAINAIPVEFYSRDRKAKPILDDWQAYMSALNNHQPDINILMLTRNNAFYNLLHKMAKHLGYDFNRTELESSVYYPSGHQQAEQEQDVIRRGLVRLLSGEAALPMAVTQFPGTVDEQSFNNQAALTKLFTEWLEGQRAVNVSNVPPASS